MLNYHLINFETAVDRQINFIDTDVKFCNSAAQSNGINIIELNLEVQILMMSSLTEM